MTITPVEQIATSLGVASVAWVVALSFTPADINTAIIGFTGLVTAITVLVGVVAKWRADTKDREAQAKERAVQATKLDTVVTNTDEIASKAASIAAKADDIVRTTAKIDGHVNSEKTAGEGRENTLKRENELLREQLTEAKKAAALLAQAAVTVPSHPGSSVEGVSPAASLKKIDKNTAAIEQNTAKTEATVQDLKDKA